MAKEKKMILKILRLIQDQVRYKTRLHMTHAAAGPIKQFDSALMMAVMDHITVYEDGRLKIRFYDETEFEVATE